MTTKQHVKAHGKLSWGENAVVSWFFLKWSSLVARLNSSAGQEDASGRKPSYFRIIEMTLKVAYIPESRTIADLEPKMWNGARQHLEILPSLTCTSQLALEPWLYSARTSRSINSKLLVKLSSVQQPPLRTGEYHCFQSWHPKLTGGLDTDLLKKLMHPFNQTHQFSFSKVCNTEGLNWKLGQWRLVLLTLWALLINWNAGELIPVFSMCPTKSVGSSNATGTALQARGSMLFFDSLVRTAMLYNPRAAIVCNLSYRVPETKYYSLGIGFD